MQLKLSFNHNSTYRPQKGADNSISTNNNNFESKNFLFTHILIIIYLLNDRNSSVV